VSSGLALPTLRDGDLTLRPLTDEDLDPLAAVVTAPGVREWWDSSVDDPEQVREGLRAEGGAFAIEVGGELAGWLAVSEENDPAYRHGGLDIFLDPSFHGRGLGPSALRLAARWLIDGRGHHRLTIDPAHDNARAIKAYTSLGFRPVGVMRRYERGSDGRWRDGLLMDMLAEELTPGEPST
jgi:aminoglycoside 6'-N-acetyltransferase